MILNKNLLSYINPPTHLWTNFIIQLKVTAGFNCYRGLGAHQENENHLLLFNMQICPTYIVDCCRQIFTLKTPRFIKYIQNKKTNPRRSLPSLVTFARRKRIKISVLETWQSHKRTSNQIHSPANYTAALCWSSWVRPVEITHRC